MSATDDQRPVVSHETYTLMERAMFREQRRYDGWSVEFERGSAVMAAMLGIIGAAAFTPDPTYYALLGGATMWGLALLGMAVLRIRVALAEVAIDAVRTPRVHRVPLPRDTHEEDRDEQ